MQGFDVGTQLRDSVWGHGVGTRRRDMTRGLDVGTWRGDTMRAHGAGTQRRDMAQGLDAGPRRGDSVQGHGAAPLDGIEPEVCASRRPGDPASQDLGLGGAAVE